MWKWLVFLMGLAAVSRLLTSRQTIPLIDRLNAFVGGLFQSTING